MWSEKSNIGINNYDDNIIYNNNDTSNNVVIIDDKGGADAEKCCKIVSHKTYFLQGLATSII